MKLKKSIILLLITVCILDLTVVNAQPVFKEYFVRVNPNNGGVSVISTIPDVEFILTVPPSTTVDKINNRYFFVGNDGDAHNRLYTLDEHTGDVLYNPYFPPLGDTSDQPGELQFDDSALTLYGVCWNKATQTENFISVNEVTGAITVLNSIPGVQYIGIGCYAYDQKDHIYFFRGGGNGVDNLFSIQSTTGNILHQPPIGSAHNVGLIRYDNFSNRLYGSYEGKVFEIDPVTADTTQVASVAGVSISVSVPDYATFDEIHHCYIYSAADSILRLYSIDVTSGAVMSNPPFPVGLDSGENVIELNYDNSNSTLYALHWGYSNKATGINAISKSNNLLSYYPNPVTNSITFCLQQEYGNSVISIYSISGQKVMGIENTNVSQTVVNMGDLQKGAYFFEVIGDGVRVGQGTIIVQ